MNTDVEMVNVLKIYYSATDDLTVGILQMKQNVVISL